MNFWDSKAEIQQLLSRVDPKDLPRLLDWMKNSDELDEVLVDNQTVILQSISEDLRGSLPLEAMLPCETTAIQRTRQQSHPTVHVDSFLYDEELVDRLCDERKMSRNYCLSCGSHSTAPLEFISHSFSIPELRFLFHNVLPDLTGKILVDVGSRLGAVLYGGYLYSSAQRLVGVELSEEFVRLQNMVVEKYGLSDRVQVVHTDVSCRLDLVQESDVLIMNNVFQFFMEPRDQILAWQSIRNSFCKKGALLVTVPSLEHSLSELQGAGIDVSLQGAGIDVSLQGAGIDVSLWLEELPLDYDVYLGTDTDREALGEIHLYRVL